MNRLNGVFCSGLICLLLALPAYAEPRLTECREQIDLYMDEDWYRSAAGPETVIAGILNINESGTGPFGRRAAERFWLATEDKGDVPLYVPTVPQSMTGLAGNTVKVEGKWVDLADEGLGLEFWPARLCP